MPPRKPRPFYIHPKRAQIVRMLLAGRRNADITSELEVGKQIVSDLRKDLSMSRSQLSQKGGEAIERMVSAGVSQREAARRTGVSEKKVRVIQKKVLGITPTEEIEKRKKIAEIMLRKYPELTLRQISDLAKIHVDVVSAIAKSLKIKKRGGTRKKKKTAAIEYMLKRTDLSREAIGHIFGLKKSTIKTIGERAGIRGRSKHKDVTTRIMQQLVLSDFFASKEVDIHRINVRKSLLPRHSEYDIRARSRLIARILEEPHKGIHLDELNRFAVSEGIIKSDYDFQRYIEELKFANIIRVFFGRYAGIYDSLITRVYKPNEIVRGHNEKQ